MLLPSERLQAVNCSSSCGSSPSGANFGWNPATAARSSGKTKPNGSMASKRIGVCGRVKRQFMVKVNGDQSVSTIPVRGDSPSLKRLGEPPIHRLQPGGARNRPSTWKVSTPWPNSDRARRVLGPAPGSGVTVTASTPMVPFHVAVKPCGLRISQPWALAMLSGRQR